MWRAEESCAHNAGPGSAGESGVTARRSLRGSSAAIACGKRQSAALPPSSPFPHGLRQRGRVFTVTH